MGLTEVRFIFEVPERKPRRSCLKVLKHEGEACEIYGMSVHILQVSKPTLGSWTGRGVVGEGNGGGSGGAMVNPFLWSSKIEY